MPAPELKEIEFTVQLCGRKDGNRMGYIKTSEDDWFGVPPNLLAQFHQGDVCTVEYKAKPRQGGGEWRDITRILSKTSTVPPKVQASRPATNPTDSERMWSCAILEAFIRAGKVELDVTSLAAANKIVTTVYANSFGSKDVRKDDEMDDGIPY